MSARLARRTFLTAIAGIVGACNASRETHGKMTEAARTTRMPVLFIGHGSPMNAIDDNRFSRGFRELGKRLPKPKAIVAVSAHWFIDGTELMSDAQPETIHDFGGFPEALHRIQYPAPGKPELAKRLAEELKGARTSDQWGLDHGTWTVLMHLFPQADVPTIQLSVHRGLDGKSHIELGKALSELREEGVLIVGSGNIVHNLRHAFGALRSGETAIAPWANAFDQSIQKALEQRDAAYLAGAASDHKGRQAHPSPDHYFPLLYAFGASDEKDTVSFPIEGFDMSSISMRSVMFA